jgi:hypothetical protein
MGDLVCAVKPRVTTCARYALISFSIALISSHKMGFVWRLLRLSWNAQVFMCAKLSFDGEWKATLCHLLQLLRSPLRRYLTLQDVCVRMCGVVPRTSGVVLALRFWSPSAMVEGALGTQGLARGVKAAASAGSR